MYSGSFHLGWYIFKKIDLNPSIDIFAVDEINNILYGYNYDTPDSFYKYNLHPQ